MAGKTFNTGFLRTVAMIFVSAGAVGSLYFMFNASRNQRSILLIVLFTVWVLSPFAGFFIMHKLSNRWTIAARAFLYWLTIIVTIVSVIAYGGAFNSPDTKNAFVFLVVPFLSWVLIIIFVLIARRLSH